MNVLIVRLGALGDIIHAIPAAAALRAAMPDARIDWVVDAKHREILDLVSAIDRVVTLDARTLSAWVDVVRRLRLVPYDVALDFQGLLKSAVLARASGARRVYGFSIWHLREKAARPFYTSSGSRPPSREASADSGRPGGGNHPDGAEPHVIQKNLNLLTVIGVNASEVAFPLVHAPSAVLDHVKSLIGSGSFALLNPSAAWPNKRWPAERYGEVATFLREIRGIPSLVLWGPGEQDLAREVVRASSGAAVEAPATRIVDLLDLSRAAALVVSGDTGPLHIAAATGTPTVAIFGPTDPGRNGPWSPDDVIVSRYQGCGCHYARRCQRASWCLADVSVAEVTAAIQQRLGRVRVPPQSSVRLQPDDGRLQPDTGRQPNEASAHGPATRTNGGNV
jgi:ADP-heptose:LPS heptosyltransferase